MGVEVGEPVNVNEGVGVIVEINIGVVVKLTGTVLV
jgi:hypothetical protein